MRPGPPIETRWKKGFAPNPHGRPPKVKCIPDILARIGSENLPADVRGKLPGAIKDSPTMLEALMRMTYIHALRGQSWAVQFIAERTEGKVKDVLSVEQAQRLVVVEEIVDGTSNALIELQPDAVPVSLQTLPDAAQDARKDDPP